MSTRRRLLRGFALGFLLAGSQTARSDEGPDWAAAFIRDIGNEIADIARSSQPLSERQRRLQTLIDRVADVDDAARFCLGRFWRQATPAQQSEYLQLFHAILMKVVLARIHTEAQDRTEVQVTIRRPAQREDGVYVPTVVERTGNPPVEVTWVVRADALHPRLIDVIAEGTSLRLTVRSDYSGFLAQHANNIDLLLQALREQACDNCAPPKAAAAR